MPSYNQRLQGQTAYACTIYTMLNILQFDYWVVVKIDNILWIVNYMEKIGALMPKGAYFWVIYPAMVKLLEWKTGLKFKVKKWYISQGLDSKYAWGLWFLKATKYYETLARDQLIDKEDIDLIIKNKKGYGHNHFWKRGTIIESLWGYHYKVDINTLKYAVNKWVYYDSARTIIPWDERTKKIQKRLIEIAKNTKKPMIWERFKVTKFD